MNRERFMEGSRSVWCRFREFMVRHQEGWMVSITYFFMAFMTTKVKLGLTSAWGKVLLRNHNRLLDFNYYNNEQSRLLQWLIPEGFHRLFGLDITDAYLLQRLLFTWLAFVLFHLYLRRWFKPSLSFAGVSMLAAALPFTFINDLQESSSLLLVTFVSALWTMRERRDVATAGVLWVGGLNNETMLCLPLIHLTWTWRGWAPRNLFPTLLRTALVSLPMILTVGLIRYKTSDRPHLAKAWQWPANLDRITDAFLALPMGQFTEKGLYPVYLFGTLWVFAVWRIKDLPSYLRHTLVLVPFFVLPNLMTGIISEIRLMMPLAFILIPAAFFTLFP